MENQQFHVLLVTYPAQGHINPTIQFAKRLIRLGMEVTFATSLFAHSRMTKDTAAPKGMNFAVFSDGYDDGLNHENIDGQHYMSELKRRGSDALRDVIRSSSDHGRPVTCLVYTLLLPWAAEVAREVHIPSALLWIQPATVLDIYYYYFFSGCGDEIKNNGTDPYWKIQFPGLPLLESRDLPSFIVPNDSTQGNHSYILPIFKSQLDTLNEEEEEERPTVLVNTFDALEPEALRAFDKYNMIGIGPLVPSGKDSSPHRSDASFGNLFEETKDYKEWLNSKRESSVIYVSFGSLLNLERQQMVEIARALLDIGTPFLWVIRAKENGQEELDDELLSLLTNVQLQEKGMIVPWCSQVDVLSHPSLGCFLTHCGWNSTLESIVYGVPVIAFPQWTDQGTNAKLLESVWETGVRVVRAKEDGGGGGIVGKDEIKRCIELVMEDGGRKAMELRKNAQKWKDLAREAMREGGSSDKNLKSFLEDVGERYSIKNNGNKLT